MLTLCLIVAMICVVFGFIQFIFINLWILDILIVVWIIKIACKYCKQKNKRKN